MKTYINLIRSHSLQYPYASVERAMYNLGLRKSRIQDINKDTLLVTWTPWKGSMSYHLGEQHKARKGKWLVLENGYVPKIQGVRYYAIGLNGYNGMGKTMLTGNSPDRWESFNLKYYRKNDLGYVLVIGQFGHKDTRISMPKDWPDIIIDEIRKYTDRQIIYKPKLERPRLLNKQHVNVTVDGTSTLDDLIGGAHVVIVYSSKAAIAALLRNVPVIVIGPYSIAKDICCNDLSQIETVAPIECEQFFYDLAHTQWNEVELASGAPFKSFLV